MIAPTSQEIAARVKHFERECHRRGLRVTNQRREIFKTVASSKEHPSAERVFDAVRCTMSNVSLDTVYRTLASLEKMDLLVRVGTPEKERFDGDLRPHAHFICNRCGEVYDIFSPEVTTPVELPRLTCGEVKHVNIQYKGICKRCRK
ncbi:Fur family transcriptional regulator [Candidatus Avelusimicrobium luingense]|uniref:Fur family transcriptional regulator n=1 Tax=Candidatus Avelusimicrobium luingense TaxID=3416211 RepID=UPI003D11AD5E